MRTSATSLLLLFLAGARLAAQTRSSPQEKLPELDGAFEPVSADASWDWEEMESRLCYPETARRERIEGTVVVVVRLDRRGGILECSVKQSSSPLLEEELLRVVRGTTFSPAMQASYPIESRVTIEAHFHLLPINSAPVSEPTIPAAPSIN